MKGRKLKKQAEKKKNRPKLVSGLKQDSGRKGNLLFLNFLWQVCRKTRKEKKHLKRECAMNSQVGEIH